MTRATTGDGRLCLLLPVLIFSAVATVFLPTLRGQFLDWDDSINFVANPHYRGLGWSQLSWMFSATLMGHYIPVTWMSLGLNYVLGGMNPRGYHLGNVLLHAVNATLVYLIARRLLAAAAGDGAQDTRAAAAVCGAGAFAALAFGVHPLRVESVAWITERRDVLCGVFFLLAVLAYLKGVEQGGGGLRPVWRWLSLGSFLLALLAKAAAMPLPAVLLLLDLYPLRRRPAGWRALLVEKVPYVVLTAATAWIALVVLSRGAAVTPYDRYGVLARVGMVAYSLLFYPVKFLWPMRLSPMYELPARVDLGAWPFLPAVPAVVAITAILVLARHRWPAGLATWTYSAIMVLPVSGVVHSGSQLVNDRYSYLSGIAFAVLGGGGILWILRLRQRGRLSARTASAVAGGVGLLVVMLGLAAWLQMQIWQDSEALWRWAVDVDPSCSVCQGNLGAAIATGPSGPARLDEAEGHLRRAIELRPDNAIPYFNLGNLFLARKQYDEAETAFLRYGELAPGHTNGLARLGLLALLRGHYADAIPLLERAQGIRARPAAAGDTSTVILLATAIGLVEDDPGVLILLGQALVEQGRPAEAIGPLRRAVTLAPWAVRAHVSLVLAYRDIGRADLVREELTVLRQLDPAAADHLPVR